MHIQKSAAINTNNPTHHYLHPGTGWTNIDIVAMCEYPVNWLIVAASICRSRAWYDYHHWRRLVKVSYFAQSGVALFCKKAMCVCFDELVHIFLCSPAVNNFQSATDKFVNFAWGNCCHFLPRKLNKTINDHIECMQNCETYNIFLFSLFTMCVLNLKEIYWCSHHVFVCIKVHIGSGKAPCKRIVWWQ